MRTTLNTPVVVYAPSYDENSGGSIVLHLLVDKLRKVGIDAYLNFFLIKPTQNTIYEGKLAKFPVWLRTRPITSLLCRTKYLLDIYRYQPKVSDFLDTPIASRKVRKAAIAIYPESVDGNPLKATKVVRWLLHRPGFMNCEAFFHENELVFYFSDVFKGQYKDLPKDRLLRLRLIRKDCYFEPTDTKERSQDCYIVRKGKKYGISPEQLRKEGKVVIDGLSHPEIGEIFRRSRYLISFDPNTLYLRYAVMCGCVPILIKPANMSQDEFESLLPPDAPEIAVGFNDVDRASGERSSFFQRFYDEQKKEDALVENFVRTLKEAFCIGDKMSD